MISDVITSFENEIVEDPELLSASNSILKLLLGHNGLQVADLEPLQALSLHTVVALEVHVNDAGDEKVEGTDDIQLRAVGVFVKINMETGRDRKEDEP